jgi:hypothetical protein
MLFAQLAYDCADSTVGASAQVVRLPCSFESPVIGDALSMRACRIIAMRVRGGGSRGMTGRD